MIPIVDKPVIQYVIEEAVASGITDILMVIGKGKRAIEEHFDRNFELEYQLKQTGKRKELEEIRRITDMANIHFVWQKELNGLGDAIRYGRLHVGNEPFAVLLGDTILKTENGGEAWSYLNLPNENTIQFNSVSFVNGNLGFAVGSGEEETILKTTNAGVSWEILESPTPVNLTRATFFNENQGLIYGNAGVIFRMDTGLFVNVEEQRPSVISDNTIKLYPNPASEYTLIGPLRPEEGYHQINIYNVQGILVRSIKIDQDKQELKITCPGIPPGIYFVKLIGERSERTFKLVKLN